MRRGRQLAILLSIATALTIAWWVSGPSDEAEGISANLEAPSRSALEANHAPRSVQNVPRVEQPAMAATQRMEIEPSGSLDEQEVIVSGCLIVLDKDGLEHSLEDGSFVPQIWRELGGGGYWGGGDREEPVSVSMGRFQVMLGIGEKLELTELFLGGKPAIPKEEIHVPEPPGRDLTVVATWLASPRLVVKDRDSFEILSPVDVVQGPRDWVVDDSLMRLHPGSYEASDLVYKAAPAPLALDPELFAHPPRSDTYIWVRAPGYAWARSSVRFLEHGDVEVLLEPSAELAVTLLLPEKITTKNAKLRPTLRLRGRLDPEMQDSAYYESFLPENNSNSRAQAPSHTAWLKIMIRRLKENEQLLGELFLEWQLRGGTEEFLFSGLPPGKITVAVELGPEFVEEKIILGWSSAVLVAGERGHIQFRPDPPPLFKDPVPVRGDLYVPPKWGARKPRLTLLAVDGEGLLANPRTEAYPSKVTKAGAREGLYKWSAGKLVPGRYSAVVDSFHFSQEFTVPAEGNRDVHIEIGAPAEVSIRVFDTVTGQLASIEAVHWYSAQSPGAKAETFGVASFDQESGSYGFVAPAGRVDVFCWGGAGYDLSHELLDVHPDGNDISLYVTPTSTLSDSSGASLDGQEED